MPQTKRGFAWILLHLTVIALSLLSVFTGLRIAAVSRPEILHLSALLPQGYLHQLHLGSAAGLIAVVIGYILLLRFERGRRFKHGHFHHRVTQFGYAIVIALTISGTLLYFGSDWAMQDLHYYFALTFVLYFFLHAVIMFIQYGTKIIPCIISSQTPRRHDGYILTSAIVVVVALLFALPPSTDKTLKIKAIPVSHIIDIDGSADEAIWDTAKAITLHTHGGANFRNGQTPVTVRAIHNGIEAYFAISWLDESESLKHLPLIKTLEGWQVTEDGFYHFDEQSHYEDKFAIMLANNCDSGASKTAQLGPKPLKNKPANWHGKGYHYATDGKIRDIWHWKAVRTNDMYLADDNFFGAPDTNRDGQRRYTAGYLQDGKESGAYIMNWQWYSPNGIKPKRLPKDHALLNAYQPNDAKQWVVPWYDFDLYDVKNDTFPIGTLAPSVLHYSNRFEGDRGQVRARGKWKNGRWSLELVRALDTQSKHDVAIQSGVCFWVAAFDRAQIAHTRHVRPLRLELEAAQ